GALRAASQLVQLQDSAPTSAIGIVARARGDIERLGRALQAAGYWAGSVTITLAGLPLDTPDLADRLDAARPPIPVRIAVDRRDPFTIGQVSVQAGDPAQQEAVAAATAEPFGLAPGDPARIPPILDAERTLVDRLLRAGHPLATVVSRQAVVDYDRHALDVAWVLAPGPVARFAPPEVVGERQVDPNFLRRFTGQLAGQPYSPERLERMRNRLLGLGPFGSVSAQTADHLDSAGQLPVTFTVIERARHAVGVTAAYETNYGPSFRVFWEHRNLFGGAERLRLDAEIARLGSTTNNTTGVTSRVFATLTVPGLFGQDLRLIGTVGALEERLLAWDRNAGVASVLLEKPVTPRLTLRAGPTADAGTVGPSGGPMRAYQVLGFETGLRWDGTDNLLDPAHGARVNTTLTPSYELRQGQPFAPLVVTATTYFDVLGDRRSILALRGRVGSLLGANRLDVPNHLRFYAGGGGSVRGYDYQSIGPRNPATGRPVGGSSLVEASIEWRQRLWGNFGAVVFADAGSVGTGTAPGFNRLRIGVGGGLRYYTPIGPIRADLAFPLEKQQGSSGYGIYVGIGQAF
ncbi:MAG TPA: autotransporter assembly complex family protein, partial [Crenalkalicoccus sp.]|nr:autotransporter assembly complex family protein [Crenalkalicoccus sp.]